ncbi:hypothetical protein PR048_023015 [Dryococelus australis]|uniref:Uncharacterized protein n=1 Tax=Dryococelus australis TaxID=614101 RepID=A0ABQ9GSY2_9NEOP|nr:hypothetical protein PR048_023015 [Dryococelus australis]
MLLQWYNRTVDDLDIFWQAPVETAGLARLTDTSMYTGSHRQRFDEAGRGRGLAGRTDIAEDHGYVTGYKGRGTYDSGANKKP